MIKVKRSTNSRKVIRRLKKTEKSFKLAVRRGLFAWAKDLKKTASDEIKRKPKSGETYYIRDRAGRSRRHVASAPGESHANLSGKTRKSLSWKVNGSSTLDFGYGVATNKSNPPTEWGVYLEEGTKVKGKWRMYPRPSIKNAIVTTLPRADTHFKRELEEILNRESI